MARVIEEQLTPEEQAVIAMLRDGPGDDGPVMEGAAAPDLLEALAGAKDLPSGAMHRSPYAKGPGAPGEAGHSRVAVGGDPVTKPRALPGDLITEDPGPSPQLSGMDPRAPRGQVRPHQATGMDKFLLAMSGVASAATGKEDALGFNKLQAQRAASEKARVAAVNAGADRQDLQRRIGERIGAQTGFDPNMTVEEYQRAIQGSAAKRGLQGLKGDQALEQQRRGNVQQSKVLDDTLSSRESEGAANRESAEKRARIGARGRRSAGGAGAPGGGMSRAMDKYVNGDPLTGEESNEVFQQMGRMDTGQRQYVKGLHAEAVKRHESQSKEYTKIVSSQSGLNQSLGQFRSLSKSMSPHDLAAAYDDAGSAAPSTDAGRQLRDSVRATVAKYVATLGGKALTDSEKAIYSGALAPWLDATAFDGTQDKGIMDVFRAARETWRSKRIDQGTVERMLGNLEAEVHEKLRVSLRGPERATALWKIGDPESQAAARDLVYEYLELRGERRSPASIGPHPDSFTEWRVQFTDGTHIDFRMTE